MHSYINLNRLFFPFIILILTSCKSGSQNIAIIPLTMLNYDTTTIMNGKAYPIKSDFYLVKGYKENSYCENYIDSFVRQHTDTVYLNKGNSYGMVFYKESHQTNLENIKKMKWRIIDRYSQTHDWIFDYEVQRGKYIKNKIKNGEVINDIDKRKNEIKKIQ